MNLIIEFGIIIITVLVLEKVFTKIKYDEFLYNKLKLNTSIRNFLFHFVIIGILPMYMMSANYYLKQVLLGFGYASLIVVQLEISRNKKGGKNARFKKNKKRI